MDPQVIIENFFIKLGLFDFDRAKQYVDNRKELYQKLAPTFPHLPQIMTMLTTFNHLAEVEKNYHNQPFINQPQHSFLSGTNFLRKAKSLKDMYNDVHIEFQQLEQMDTNSAPDKRDTSILSTATGHHLPKLFGKQTPQPDATSTDTNNSNSNSSSTDKDSPGTTQVPRSPGASIRNSFFRVLSPISSSSSASIVPQANSTASAQSTPLNDPYSLSSSSGYEPPPNSTTTTPITPNLTTRAHFSEDLLSHFCHQLQKFIQARLDMIDIYEQLVEALSRKYASLDSVAFDMSMLCRQYQKYFHHPSLAPIKEGMTLECESLMTLIRATIDMQHWRFLPTLFDLQDAQSKLSFWASSTFNKETSRKRFNLSKTNAPRLYEWLCKFKDFLISKFTLYFHSTLSRNFPLSNFKTACSKLSVDYYSKLSSFQRKADALFVALLYDVSNEKDFRGLGYNFPSKDYQHPQGKNTLQPMLIIPPDSRPKLNSLQAEIYMMIMTNTQTVIKEGHYQFHDNLKKLTYSITKPDLNIVLVIVCEGQKVDRDSHVRTFSMEITNQFAF